MSLRHRLARAALALGLGLAMLSHGAVADDPIDPDTLPRHSRYAATRAFLSGGDAERAGLEAEKAPIPGADDSAVELGPDIDAEGNYTQVHFRLEVVEIQEEVYPGEYVTFWVFAPIAKPAGQPARLPSPTLRVQQGDRVKVTLYNTHYFPHTIHLHGMSQPAAMDGVPDMSQKWVAPGESFTYEFVAGQPGTYFYHCHVHEHVHVPMGLGGMFIVEPRRPNNRFARLVPGAGRIAVMAKGTAEQAQGEYSLVFLDIDDRLNRIPAAYPDAMEVERRMHRDYDTTQRQPNIFLLNGRSFPFTLRDTPIIVKPDETTKLRILNLGGRTVYFHTHGHHPTLTDVDGRPLPPAARITRDTFDVGPAQRIDLALKTGSDGYHAAGPGAWMVHDHSLAASTNKGIGPGGSHTMILYEGLPTATGAAASPDAAAAHAQHNHARYFDPEYYRGRQPVFGTEIFKFRPGSATIGSTPAGNAAPPIGGAFTYPTRGPALPALPRLDLIDAERHRTIASACPERARSFKRIVVKAGRDIGAPGQVFAFEPREITAERCQEIELVLDNRDQIRHDLMIAGLNPMFTLNLIGPGLATARFITPDEDVTLPFHCHVPAHDKVGMSGLLIVGLGSRTDASPKPIQVQATSPAQIYEGIGIVIATVPRQARLIIKHDEIKGFMAAMEMAYPVVPPSLLDGLGDGDKIGFTINASQAAIVGVKVIERAK